MKSIKYVFIALLAACFLGVAGAETVMNKNVKLELDLYLRDAPSSTILFAPGCDGYTQNYHARARNIRSWGYNVVAIDSLTGRGVTGTMGTCLDQVPRVNSPERASDYLVVADWVANQKWHSGRIGIIGYSAGAGGIEHLIMSAPGFTAGKIDAAVEYYPWCKNPVKPNIPTMLHIGSLDTWTPPDRCSGNNFKTQYEMFVYEGATHAFDVFKGPRSTAGHDIRYNKEADILALSRTRAFFEKHLMLAAAEAKATPTEEPAGLGGKHENAAAAYDDSVAAAMAAAAAAVGSIKVSP